jgi:hypothetical protein
MNLTPHVSYSLYPRKCPAYRPIPTIAFVQVIQDWKYLS